MSILAAAVGCSKEERATELTALYPRERFYDAITAQARFSGSAPTECGFTIALHEGGYPPAEWPADIVGDGFFECYITGLAINTLYDVTPFMVVGGERIVGTTIRTFSAANTIEYITLATALEFDGSDNTVNITSSTADVRGAALFLGGSGQQLREYGAYYWKKSVPDDIQKITITADPEMPVPVNTLFTVSLTNLDAQTEYSAKIWGRNDRREVVTEAFDFTTL